MLNNFLLVLILFPSVIFSQYSDASIYKPSLKIELIDSLLYINIEPIPANPAIDNFKKFFGEASKTKNEIRHNKIDKTKSKWREHIFDNAGIKISESIDSNRLISLEISYSSLKSATKEPFRGEFYVNGILIKQGDTKEQIQNKLPNFQLSDFLGVCFLSDKRTDFTVCYNHWANGIQFIVIYF